MSTIEQCPAETIDSIVSFLNLRDICNLRLTSRGLALRVSVAPSLGSYLEQRQVDVTERSLRAVAEATAKPGRLGCFIDDLVLVGVVNNTKFLTQEVKYAAEDTGQRAKAQQDLGILTRRQTEYETLHASRGDVLLLSQIFRNLMAHGRRRGLRSLSLAVVVNREDAQTRLPPADGGGWTLIWQAAADTFLTALAAFAASGIAVQRLDVYNGVERCSLACNEPSAVNFEFNTLATSLASLKTLAVSFSDRVINPRTEDFGLTGDSADVWDEHWEDELREPEDIEHELYQDSTFSGLPALIQRCRRLESLELHHYQLEDLIVSELNRHRERFFPYIAEMIPLPPLKRLVLRGLRVRSADVLAFLQRLQPTLRELSLRNLILLDGAKFENIYCIFEEAGLEQLYLDHLLEPVVTASGAYSCRRLVYFTGEPNQEPKLRRKDLPHRGSNTVDRIGAAQIRRPIPYFSVSVPFRERGSRPAFSPNIRAPYPLCLYGQQDYGPP
ncbi:hypothetical protein N7491_008424 [Penicillium cf. griseofulvum]|uniref:F-box domain-containing protein n=1 Tax=Penicillium cf. griseofulvum TaxID=2972120 RepID=A0A9W9MGB2_9EURO|nr:hypothetical protein N7472_005974 [Penicillium cf. griseofulvum]KAJ5423208.1 hypothetical protein N7491_008424 [Penicillium cf. griseofulvum]KAJ5431519.1 hypothetical protein N7445_009251 [Penicillium cf. griseofulvum]